MQQSQANHPAIKYNSTSMVNTIPPQVAKYFWGDNLAELDLHHHQQYIVQTLLEKGDLQAVDWLFEHLPKAEVMRMLPTLKLSQKSANFRRIYLS